MGFGNFAIETETATETKPCPSFRLFKLPLLTWLLQSLIVINVFDTD